MRYDCVTFWGMMSHVDSDVAPRDGGNITGTATVKKNRALNETPSQSYGMSLAIWKGSRSVTFHPTQANILRLNPSQTGRYSIYLYPGGMEG